MDSAEDLGASLGTTLNSEIALDGGGAELHHAQAHTGALLGRWDASVAVVLDAEHELTGLDCELEANCFAAGVFDSVVYRLLSDAEEVGSGRGIGDRDIVWISKPATDAVESSHPGGLIAEGVGESFGNGRDGLQAVGEAAGGIEGVVEVAGQALDFACFGSVLGLEAEVQFSGQEMEAVQDLAEFVVEFVSDLLAFAFADFQEFKFQAFAIGDFVG